MPCPRVAYHQKRFLHSRAQSRVPNSAVVATPLARLRAVPRARDANLDWGLQRRATQRVGGREVLHHDVYLSWPGAPYRHATAPPRITSVAASSVRRRTSVAAASDSVELACAGAPS